MNCEAVLKKILPVLQESDITLFNLGINSRVANYVKDRPTNFYMLGSMGLVSSLGLGIALNAKEKVYIFDGDGSLLMDLGVMPTIAQSNAKNLIHIVMDNQSYCSTGKQPTCLKGSELAEMAKVAGYKHVITINNQPSLESRMKDIITIEGPSFILIKTEQCEVKDYKRVQMAPQEITERFIKAKKSNE